MRYFTMGLVFSLLPSVSFGVEVIQTCQLGNRPAHSILTTREDEISASYIYKFRYGGVSRYFYDDPDASRGWSVHAMCVGKKQHALVVYGEFSSNFLQGFVITRNTQTGKLYRLDFAERSPPQWIYMGEHETLAIMPSHGRGESGDKTYIVYRRANQDDAEAAISGTSVLPPSSGFEVVQLPGGDRK